MSTRAVLHQLETLTYNVTENEKETLVDVNHKLKDLYCTFYERMPHKEGLILRPPDQRQIINTRRRVGKAKVALKCSSLPYWRSRKRAPSSYRNRFGAKADRLRKADKVCKSTQLL